MFKTEDINQCSMFNVRTQDGLTIAPLSFCLDEERGLSIPYKIIALQMSSALKVLSILVNIISAPLTVCIISAKTNQKSNYQWCVNMLM